MARETGSRLGVWPRTEKAGFRREWGRPVRGICHGTHIVPGRSWGWAFPGAGAPAGRGGAGRDGASAGRAPRAQGGASLEGARVLGPRGASGEAGAAGRGAGPAGRRGSGYLSNSRARRGLAMALRRILAAVRSRAPRLAPLSTAAPKTREQPAAGRGAVRGRGAAEAVRPPVPTVEFDNAQEAYRSRRSWELVRSLLVLRLCASPALLAHHEQVRAGLCVAGGRGERLRRPPGSSARPGVRYELSEYKEGLIGHRL